MNEQIKRNLQYYISMVYMCVNIISYSYSLATHSNDMWFHVNIFISYQTKINIRKRLIVGITMMGLV